MEKSEQVLSTMDLFHRWILAILLMAVIICFLLMLAVVADATFRYKTEIGFVDIFLLAFVTILVAWVSIFSARQIGGMFPFTAGLPIFRSTAKSLENKTAEG